MQTVTRFVLSNNLLMPPPKPPRPLGGDHCWRATCDVLDDELTKLGAFVGYDDTIGITQHVHKACELHCKIRPGTRCREPELVLLPSSRRECSGQIFYYERGSSRRIL
jgi:hypothetical protein